MKRLAGPAQLRLHSRCPAALRTLLALAHFARRMPEYRICMPDGRRRCRCGGDPVERVFSARCRVLYRAGNLCIRSVRHLARSCPGTWTARPLVPVQGIRTPYVCLRFQAIRPNPSPPAPVSGQHSTTSSFCLRLRRADETGGLPHVRISPSGGWKEEVGPTESPLFVTTSPYRRQVSCRRWRRFARNLHDYTV